MPPLERQAWFNLGIVALTLTVYAAFIKFVRFDPVSLSVFALSGFLGVNVTKRRRGEIRYDERDREIENRSLLVSLRSAFAVLLILAVTVSLSKGEDYSVPVWALMQFLWGSALAMFGVRSALVILAYRRGGHA